MAKFFRVYPKGSPKESRYYSGYERKIALDRAYADMGRDQSLVIKQVGFAPEDAIVYDAGLSFEERFRLLRRNKDLA